jgi:undecaprenyl-diphosphatase
VGVALLVGGVVLLFVDKWFIKNEDTEVTFRKALATGCFQIVSMIPGVSRSAATIVGGMAQGMSRRQAAEFSFFLAVPTMFGATVLDLKDNYHLITKENIQLLLLGNAVAFVVAMLAIKSFITFLLRYGFKWFGVYRIVVGAVVIALLLMGYDLHIL